MCAGGLVSAMFTAGDDIGIAVVNTTLAPGITTAKGLFIEMFMTAELVFVVLMLAAEKSKDTFLAPVGIGLALLVAELAGALTAQRPFRPLLPPPATYPLTSLRLPQASTTPAARSTRPGASAAPWPAGASPATTGSTGSDPCSGRSSRRHTIGS